MAMQLSFDLSVGALYIRLTDHAVARTRQAGDNAAVDLDDAGQVVGIEVISIAHPWPISEIIADYAIPKAEIAQLRTYFGVTQLAGDPRQETPVISMASPAPSMVTA